MSDTQLEIQYKEHLESLRDRTKACTIDELRVMADTIARINPDILLDALSVELQSRKQVIDKFKMALEREEA